MEQNAGWCEEGANEMLAVVPAATPPTQEREIDEVTLRRAMRGEAAAARAVVVTYQGRVFALLGRMLAGRGKATVEDVAQETFLAVFRQLPKFDVGGAAKVSTWVLTIAARRAIDEMRRKRPALVADAPEVRAERDGADERARRRELVGAIEAALRELTPELRAAFLLREYHGLEYTEIAAALEIDIGTVKSRLSRARAALRERLAEVKDG